MRVMQNVLFLFLLFLCCDEYVKKEKTIYQYVPQNTFSLIQINESTSFKELLNFSTFKPFVPKNDNLLKLSPIIQDNLDKVSLICFSSLGKDKFSTTLIHEKTPDSIILNANISNYSCYDIEEKK